MTRALTVAQMEDLIDTYYDACNQADINRIEACFTPDAVHYFPPGMYDGPFVTAGTIAQRWVNAVASLGSSWTKDSFVGDADSGQAVIEWSHFKQYQGKLLRGTEWFDFDSISGLIREVRAYYASPQEPNLDRLELGGFDYGARGYGMEPPVPHAPESRPSAE